MSRFAEVRLFLGYMALAARPGAAPPQHPQPMVELDPPPDDWSEDDLEAFIAQAQRTVDGQQSDKRDIRGRSQVLLTTTFVVGGISATSGQQPGSTWWWWCAYLLGLGFVALSGLASAGILTGRSNIGTPSVGNLVHTESGQVVRQTAREYAAIVHVGANTVAVLVTVLRSAVLSLLIGFAFSVFAYLARS